MVGLESGKYVRVERHAYNRLLFQWASTIKIQRSLLVYKVHIIIISLKCNLFSSQYSWKIASLAWNNDHPLTLDHNTISIWIEDYLIFISTVKPAHVVTSIKQSPVLKGHLFCPVIENFIWIEPLLRGHLS